MSGSLLLSQKRLPQIVTEASGDNCCFQMCMDRSHNHEQDRKPKPKPRPRQRPRLEQQKQQRLAAYDWVRCLDHALLKMFGYGLMAFEPEEDYMTTSLKQRPLLTLSLDQGSDGWAAVWWLTFKARLRLVFTFDPFHREHNDILNAIKQAKCWSAVLLTGMVHNLVYGPWDGSKWFQAMKDGAVHYFSHCDIDDPLYEAFYMPILADQGVEPDMTNFREQMDEVLDKLPVSGCFEKKGLRTAFRRRFSWFMSHSWHDQYWHTRLMTLCYVGLQLGIYKSLADIPFNDDSSAFKARQAEPLEDDPSDDDVPDRAEAQKVVDAELRKADAAALDEKKGTSR